MNDVQFKLLFVGLCTAISAAGDDASTPSSEDEAAQTDNWRSYYETLYDQLLAKYSDSGDPSLTPAS